MIRLLTLTLIVISFHQSSLAQDAELDIGSEVKSKTVDVAEKLDIRKTVNTPTLDELMENFANLEKKHSSYRVRHKELTTANTKEVRKILERSGFLYGKEFVTTWESSLVKDQWQRKCVSHLVDGTDEVDRFITQKKKKYDGIQIPMPLLGVFPIPLLNEEPAPYLLSEFYQNHPDRFELSFENHIARVKVDLLGDDHISQIEISMLQHANQKWWVPFQVSMHSEVFGDVEWILDHYTMSGDEIPRALDGRFKVDMDGEQFTIRFAVESDAYGHDAEYELGVSEQSGQSIDPDRSIVATPKKNVPAAAPADIADAPASDPTPLSATPVEEDSFQKQQVIVIEVAPGSPRSAVIDRVVEVLEKNHQVQQVPEDRIGKPIGLIATVSANPNTPHRKIKSLIEDLQKVGVQRFSLKATDKQQNQVSITAPANTTWRQVKQLEALIENNPDFEGGVLVVANDDPVTPTVPLPEPEFPQIPPTNSAPREWLPPEPKSPIAATPPVSEADPFQSDLVPDSEAVKVQAVTLKFVNARTAQQMIEQLLDRTKVNVQLSVNEKINTLIIVGSEREFKLVSDILRILDVPEAKETPATADAQPTSSAESSSRRPANSQITIHSDTTQLRAQYEKLEQAARSLATEQSDQPEVKKKLRDLVRQAFEARQALQRAELNEFAQRMQMIQESLNMRQRISEKIIERRVEELLDPNVNWEQQSPPNSTETSPQAALTPPLTLPDERVPEESNDQADEFPLERLAWDYFGAQFGGSTDDLTGTPFRDGLQIVELRKDGPAEKAGMRINDILVGVHIWEVTNLDNLNYAWETSRKHNLNQVKFHLVRNGETLFGHFNWDDLSVQSLARAEQGEVTRILDDKELELSLGSVDNISKEDQFRVWSKNMNPRPDNWTAIVEITQIRGADRSVARVIQGDSQQPLAKGDRVIAIPDPAGIPVDPTGSNAKKDTRLNEVASSNPDLILDLSPSELQELIANRVESIRQINESIQRWKKMEEGYRDKDDLDKAVSSLQRQLKEYEQKLALVKEQWQLQVKLLESALNRDQERLKVATASLDRLQRLYEAGAAPQREVHEAKSQLSTARTQLQRTEAMLKLYRQAGIRLSASGESATPMLRPDSNSQDDVMVQIDGATFEEFHRMSGPAKIVAGDWAVRLTAPYGSTSHFSATLRVHGNQKPVDISLTIPAKAEFPADVPVTRILSSNLIHVPLSEHDLNRIAADRALGKIYYLPHDNSSPVLPGIQVQGYYAANDSGLGDPFVPIRSQGIGVAFIRIAPDSENKTDFPKLEVILNSGVPKIKTDSDSQLAGETVPESSPSDHQLPESTLFPSLGKLKLTFFQGEAQRTIPCLAVRSDGHCYAITSGPAVIVPDGTPPAIEKIQFTSQTGLTLEGQYDSHSTRELFLYNTPNSADFPSLNKLAAVSEDDSVSALKLDSQNQIHETMAHVLKTNETADINLPHLSLNHRFEGLITIDTRLKEGTPVFKSDQLVGVTLLGERFVAAGDQRSYIIPAIRLRELLRKIKEGEERETDQPDATLTDPMTGSETKTAEETF